MAGLAKIEQYECPLTQYDLADALGLSAIHVNRVLRELREAMLLTFQDHVVTIHNRTRLKALSGYEDIEETAALIRGCHDPGDKSPGCSSRDPGSRQ